MNIISRLKGRKQNPDYRKYGDREYYVRFLGYDWVEEILEVGKYRVVISYKGREFYNEVVGVIETKWLIEDHILDMKNKK